MKKTLKMGITEKTVSMMDTSRYVYEGPTSWHASVGQIMAHIGYTGSGTGTVKARIRLTEKQGHWLFSCTFGTEENNWCSEAYLTGNSVRTALRECILNWYSRYTHRELGPWGTLTGVRPTKLVHHLLDQGMTAAAVVRELQRRYQAALPTAENLIRMAQLQRPYVTNRKRNVALYIGIPYCISHCLYCSFPSRLIGLEKKTVLDEFVQTMEADLAGVGQLCHDFDLMIDSVYIGGGTPTCLPIELLERILKKARAICPQDVEWTVEAGRPDTADVTLLRMLRRYGVDRISVNPQTMQQPLLNLLGRQHRVSQIYDMFDHCRKMGFHTINMDFIAGLPQQTVADMQENMEIVCQLCPENVTIHTLALKKRAPLFNNLLRQDIPSPEMVARMLSLCNQILKRQGYVPYYMYRQTYMAASFANVGYALPGYIGRYNIEMMEERQTVLAVGPGSATKFIIADRQQLQKLYMPKNIDVYIQTVQEKIRQRYALALSVYGGEDT